MRFTTHNQGFVDIQMTCLQGYLRTTYLKLVNTFGQPTDSDPHKVDAEWHIRFDDGMVATVYNWKNGKAYLGDKGPSVVDITTWNVGGNSQAVVIRVQQLLNEVPA